MIVLGINGNFDRAGHDPAAALIIDGEVRAAAEEERFLRFKHAVGCMPTRAIEYCLDACGLRMSDVDVVAYPAVTYAGMESRLARYLDLHFGFPPRLEFVEHHLAHAATAHLLSPFSRSLIISADLSGDSVSTLIAEGDGSEIRVIRRFEKPNSLGLFYAMMTQYLGFGMDHDEYKIMALAAHGSPGVDLSDVLRIGAGRYELEPAFVSPQFLPGRSSPSRQEPAFSPALASLLGPARLPAQPISRRHQDIARATQERLEQAIVELINAHAGPAPRHIALAGGVALNCAMNGKLLANGHADQLFVSPVASDAGSSLGAALIVNAGDGRHPARIDPSYCIGPCYSSDAIAGALDAANQPTTQPDDPARAVAELLADGRVVALFQGRMEYGPRALGRRSILARPDSPDLRDFINLHVKGREWFRPLAPCILESHFADVFDGSGSWPYMTVTFQVRPAWRDRLSGVSHIDGSARVQTVARGLQPTLHDVLEAFCERTGIPVLLNTSLNTRGRPIVCTPEDAIETFRSSPIDALLIGDHLARHTQEPTSAKALVEQSYPSTLVDERIESP